MRTLLACLLLASCATPKQVADPATITVSDAFASVADGLAAFQKRLKVTDGLHLGVIVCKVIVKFDISAAAGLGGNAGVALAPPTEVKAKVTAGLSNTASGSRGNTVEIDLNSIDTAVCPAQKGIMNGQAAYGAEAASRAN